ncbi:MAG: hypothetical protein AB1810_10970 [Pseudomonadota bacterium]
MRKHKPDLLMVLVVFVAAGVLMTSFAFSDSPSETTTQRTTQTDQQQAMNELRP